MGQFKKGESGNPKGRPKGTKNLTTQAAKDIITGVLKSHFTPTKINKDLRELRPKDRLEVMFKLATFIVPRPQENNVKFDFEELPSEKIEQVYSIIFNKDNHERK